MTGSSDVSCRARVLVIGRSSVNRVVVSRIVERTGLKVRAETPEAGLAALAEDDPSIVILDGGPADRDCDGLIEPLRQARARDGASLPAIILLSIFVTDASRAPVAGICDMVLSKPITVDRLQPAIEAMRARNGDYGREA